jgi:hypothetical protein
MQMPSDIFGSPDPSTLGDERRLIAGYCLFIDFPHG